MYKPRGGILMNKKKRTAVLVTFNRPNIPNTEPSEGNSDEVEVLEGEVVQNKDIEDEECFSPKSSLFEKIAEALNRYFYVDSSERPPKKRQRKVKASTEAETEDESEKSPSIKEIITEEILSGKFDTLDFYISKSDHKELAELLKDNKKLCDWLRGSSYLRKIPQELWSIIDEQR